jgi:spore maturation protein CgeB
MKLFIPQINWVGNFFQYFKSAFHDSAIEVATNSNIFKLNKFVHLFKLHQISKINQLENKYYLKTYNDQLIKECLAFRPDVFFVFNESYLYPDTIKTIKEQCKCLMVCALGDDPWDSIRWVADFPHSLKYFDLIFNAEPSWNVNIKKVAPKAKILWHFGGFDPQYYFPVEKKTISQADQEIYNCDISFTGSSYGNKAEGAYRSDILSYLTDFDLKIWGDDNWEYRLKFLPQLTGKIKGGRLSYPDLRKLYTLSSINLNLPAPQIITSFQPRIFEIAAVKGFQIIDNRPLLRKLFNEDEIVTFDTNDELREKARYYLDHENERNILTERLYLKVTENFTWSHWAKLVIDGIKDM